MHSVFVPAHSKDLAVEGFDGFLQNAADSNDKLIPRAMAEVVVDVLEVVDIDEQHRTYITRP